MNTTNKKLSFILIDDNPFDLKVNERIILHGELASSVKPFTSAKVALKFIQDQGITTDLTIILLDIQMPEMDGFAFLAAFNRLADDIKKGYTILMLSSTLDEFDLRRVYVNPDAVAFLSKPLDFKALKAQLAKILSHP